MAENKLNLLQDFPAISTQEWKDKIVADLKGADFDKKLVWRTAEGFNVQPFYRQEDLAGLQATESAPGQYPYVRGTKACNDWAIRQNICTCEGAEAANAKALDVLSKGVNSLGFKLNKNELSADYIATLLKGIHADAVTLNFHICMGAAPELIAILADYYKAQGFDLEKCKGSIDVDPIGRMLTKGKNLSAEKVAERLVAAVEAGKALPRYRVVSVNSIALNNAGAYCAQELGYALAWGNEYLQILTEAGVDAAEAGCAIKFNMGIGGNYFMEIAKFRAARMLWAMIVRQYEPVCSCGDSCTCEPVEGKYCPCAMKMNVCAQTSTFNLTTFDAYVNMLRTQTEAMSAALAGVDEMVVLPFDVTYETATEFAERIARNQQLLLKEESHFNKVVDPSAGSYYIEQLTASIAEEAWKLFLDVQEKGGMFCLVKTEQVQAALTATLAARQKDMASRKEVLLGTNQYPNFTEKTEGKITKEACSCHCGCGDEERIATLPCARQAEQFETLRLATEAAAHQPKVFMLTIGNLAMRLARAQYACNYFACAGYQVIDNLGFETVEAGIEAARKAEADVIVLCSSDDEYAELAPKAHAILKDSKEIFVVAGAPACMEDLKAAGIENFIYMRQNVLAELQRYNSLLLK